MIILEVTKNHCFTLSSEDTFFEKPQGGQIDPTAQPFEGQYYKLF